MQKENLRVLQLVDSLGAGGIQAFILNVNKNIDLDKIKFDYVVYRNEKDEEFYDKSVEKMGGKIICLERNTGIKRIKSFLDLYRLQKAKHYKVVHIHGDRAKSFFEAIVFKLCNTPTIIMHSHNDRMSKDKRLYHLHLGIQNAIKHLWKYVVDYEFACSSNAAQWMFSVSDIKEYKTKVINNGIDEEMFIFNKEIRQKYREKLNVEGKFVMVHVGRFSYQKNHEFLIDIFNCVNKQYNDSVLLLIGEGELKDKIEEKVKALNLQDKVTFYGLSNEIHNILQAADVFVFPSHYEGLPVVGIEVQAASLMAVASNSISDEIKITDYWNSLSLNQPPEEWANVILKYKNGYIRRDTSKEIKNSGFSSREISKNLEELYINES